MTSANKFFNNRILLLEPEPTTSDSFSSLLTDESNNSGTSTARTYSPIKCKNKQQAILLIEYSLENKTPFAAAILNIGSLDVGSCIETIKEIWKQDSNIQILLCAKIHDKFWKEASEVFSGSDSLFFLQVPFEKLQLQQMVHVLVNKWNHSFNNNRTVTMLERMLDTKEIELSRVKANSVRANDVKSQFLSNISHEIRTPMNGIIGMTHLLMSTDLSDEQMLYATTVRNSGDLLLSIIDDILDFSKIETQRFELDSIDFDLGRTISSLNEIIACKAANKGLEYECVIEDELYKLLRGDPGRLRQILMNLLNNSIKFTERGNIKLRIFERDNTKDTMVVRFTISDTGIGIEQDKIKELFKTFTQADETSTRKYGGTGLGLCISNQLISLMHGELHVESEPGIGSTFWFDIRFEKQKHQPKSQIAGDIDIRELNILFVDDDISYFSLLTSYLRSWGCKTPLTSDNVSETLDIIRKRLNTRNPVSTVIVGKEFLDDHESSIVDRIKNIDSKISVVLISNNKGVAESELARNLHFNAYLSAPFDPSNFYNCLVSLSASQTDRSVLNAATTDEQTIQDSVLLTKENLSALNQHSEKILLVEDNYINEIVTTGLLKKFGFKCETANNGRNALDMIRAKDYDLILMDVQMPVMDGIETTKIIRSNPEYIDKQVPIIALTAHVMEGDREKFLDAGMNDYISKPISPSKLNELITEWIRKDKNEKSF